MMSTLPVSPVPAAEAGLMDLSRQVKLRLTGPDAQRYLNGQVSNDVRRLPPSGSLVACVCTHKGKLEALVTISRSGPETFFLTADETLADFLPTRMEKYLIADDAVLEDITADYSLLHVFPGNAAPGSLPAPAFSFTTTRLGVGGTDLWYPAGTALDVSFTPPEALELLRVERGIPSWTAELSSGILPQEARLEDYAIDFHKGCYTGQEVISRLKSVGQVNKKLERLRLPPGVMADPGWVLAFQNAEGAWVEAGRITSVAGQSGLALGYVKRAAAGQALFAGPEGTEPATPIEIRVAG